MIVPALKLPDPSRRTIVFVVFAVSELYPFRYCALRFATCVVDDTVKGAVPVL